MPSYERILNPDEILGTPPTRSGYIYPVSYRPIKIFQGYNGPYSHMAFYTILPSTGERGVIQDDRFSLDFEVPSGTEVVAAKNGIVSGITHNRTNWYRGLDVEIGMKEIPNVLYLLHNDGSRTVYSHLEAFSITLMMGNAVRQGQPIARTGLSGWVGPVPHLHFAALTFPEPWVRRTFPTIFEGDKKENGQGGSGSLDEDIESMGFSYG